MSDTTYVEASVDFCDPMGKSWATEKLVILVFMSKNHDSQWTNALWEYHSWVGSFVSDKHIKSSYLSGWILPSWNALHAQRVKHGTYTILRIKTWEAAAENFRLQFSIRPLIAKSRSGSPFAQSGGFWRADCFSPAWIQAYIYSELQRTVLG